MNYYDEIKENLIRCEIYDKSKDFSKNKNRVITYFKNGKLLNEAGKEYGKNIIKHYSEKLMIEVGKKYNERTLRRIRQFYLLFKNEIWSTVSTKLTWSHYVELIKFDNVDLISYYINISINNNLSVRELRNKIKNKEYQRLPFNTKQVLKAADNMTIKNFIKHPILIKNKYNTVNITERMLKNLILEDMDSFLKELGNGFCYIENEYKIKLDDRYNYIDILLFNIEFNCYVVVELKVTELKKEHIGQIEIYMNYIDKNVKKTNHNKTIGIIIAKRDNKFVMEYCSDSRIYNTTYELI